MNQGDTESSPRLVRIVPRPAIPGRPVLTQGTQVLLPDGSPLKGVVAIRLHCEPNDIWRADISLHCEAPDLECVEATFHRICPHRPVGPRWVRFLRWLTRRLG